MPFRLRLILRYLRMLAACAVLGLAAAPATASHAHADAAAWVLSLRASAPDDQPRAPRRPVAPREAAPHPGEPAPLIAGPPAGSRVVIVRDRVYLHNAALLC